MVSSFRRDACTYICWAMVGYCTGLWHMWKSMSKTCRGAQVCTLTLIRGPRGGKRCFCVFRVSEPTRMEISYIFLYGIPLHPQFLDWRVWQVTNSENPLGISLLQSSRGVTWVAPEGTRKKWQAGHIDCWDCRYCSNPHPPNVNPARKAIILLHSNLILGRWDS